MLSYITMYSLSWKLKPQTILKTYGEIEFKELKKYAAFKNQSMGFISFLLKEINKNKRQ